MAWEWKDIEPEQTENKPVANWQWKEANIERMSVLDDDSGKMYSAPVTFDEQDIRFAIDTQELKQPKENFIGKIKAVADDVWNVADAAAYGVEEVFKDAERGVVGFVGQATDAFLGYGRKNLMGDIHELEDYDPKKYKDNGLFSNPKNAVFRNLSDEKRLEMIEKRKKMIEKINQTRTKWQKTFQKVQNVLKKDENMTSMDKFVEGIGSGMASVGVSTATLLATKNPTVGASILAAGFGGMRNVEVFDKSIDAGMDFETAEKYGQIAGSIEGGIELALEPLYYSVANLKPVKQLTDRVIKQTLLKVSENAVGRSAAKKIAQHHTQSIIKQAAKGFLTEGSEEFLQDLSGMAFDNAVGLEKYSLNEMLSQSFMSMAVGGITGAGGAVVGTSVHNQRIMNNNKKIQDIIGKQYPELTVDEKNVMADALQEVFYQEESQYLDEFDKILNKENDPDTMPEGITKENMTAKTRQLLKDKYGMNDDQINKTIDVALTSIDLRHQFNEAYNQFYEQIVKTGADTKVADQASRIIAARASTVALNEKSTVNDVLERWSLQFAENEYGADNWNKIQNESQSRKDKKNELMNVIAKLKNNKTTKDDRLSLTQFLKKKGGLQDYGGELKNLDAAKSVIGLVNKKGMTLDDATMMAWENGYLNGTERPEINDLLNAVDTEIRGKKIYAADELISETEQENEALASWSQVFDEAGVDINEDINTIYEKMENYEKNEQIKSLEHKLMLSEADEERLAVMENNGLNRLQALEQLKNEKDNINLKQKDVEENLPFFQDNITNQIEKIDKEKLEFERKDINPELVGKEKEIVKAVEINRFFSDRKSSKEISIADVMAVIDKTVAKNENGVRVLKNSISGETVTLSNNAISKMFNTTTMPDNENIGGILGKECIVNIADIFDSAMLIKTHNDEKHGSKNKIHRYANVIQSQKHGDSPIETFIVKITVKELANGRKDLTDVEIEGNNGKNLTAYDLKVGRKNTAGNSLGNFAAGANATVAHNSGNNIIINDLIDFVNSYTAKSININGIERPVFNSVGKRVAKTADGLRAFYEWFGDSKVVDENGKPLVVYHGTSGIFDVFKGKYHFFSSSENVATGYGSENPMPVYLLMKNPLIVDAYGQSFEEIYNAEGYKKAHKDLTEDDYKKIAKAYDLSVDEAKEFFPKNEDGVVNLARAYGEKPRSTNEWAEYAKKNGYDGIIIKDVNDTADISNIRSTDYIVFNPNQIKSVNNRGTYDPSNDNIYHQGQISDNGSRIELSIKSVEEMQGLSEEDFKNKMLDTLKSFKGNKIFNKSLNGDIEIRTSSIKKYKSFFADKNKRLIVPYIPELLEKAKFSAVEQSYNKRETSIKAYYKADLPINIDNDAYNVHLTVREDQYGNFFWDAQVKENLQKTAPATNPGGLEVNAPRTDPATNPGDKGLKALQTDPATNPGVGELTSEVSEDTLIISPDYKKVNPSFYQSYESGHRGQYDAANRIITLFSTADPSTIIHETAHFFLDDMRRFSDNAATAEQLQAIYKYVGSLDGTINREQHEYFARSFEAYLLEGKAPNNLLAKAFNKFKNWLSHIYGNIKKLNIDLDDNIRKTFDEMLGGKKLDFAMQISSQQLLDNVNSGYIPQSVINKALRLLENGKMSKADMETMIGKLKSGELKRDGVGKYLTDFEKSGKINHEQIFPYDKLRYRNQLEYGNVTKKQITDKIDRLLEWSKPRSQNGKLVGRFTDIKVNRFFDAIRENVALSKDEAQAKIADNMKLIDAITKGEEIGNIAELVWQNKILSIPAKKANITLLADVYNAISDTYNAGRLTNAVTGEIKKAYRQRLINEVVNILDQGKGKDWRKNSSELTKRLRRFGMNSFSWNGILDILSMYDKGSSAFKSKINQNLSVFEEEKKMRIGIYNDGEVVSKLIGEALSGNKNHAISVSRYINKELPRKFEIEWNGNSKSFSKDELIDIYMKAKDPQTRQIMLDDKVLQFNEEFLARVDELITEDDAAVADALFKFYEQDYEKINVFYEQHYGISLGRSEFYSPRSMDRGGINVSSGDLRSYAGLSAIKQRKAKSGQIKPKGAFSVLQNHINNVNHYISFADKLQDINTVLGDPEIKNRIRNLFGEEMNRKIASEVSRFANNDRQFVEGVGKLMSKLRSNYAVSVLALKPALAIKQLTSFPAYWENLTTKEFLAGLADFAKNPKRAIEILGNSDLMKTRGTNIIKDFEVVSSSEKFKNLGTKTGLREFLMMNIQLGDRGAIYMGGWAVYKSVLKKTGSHEKAIAEFERITNETQQSSYMSEQSKWQSNPFLNWFTMFQSSQNQYLRKELTALRGLITGRMPKKKVFKTLFIYHLLLPVLFQFVSDGFRWDKDAQLRAAMLGSLNGLFVLGKVMERLVDWSISGQLNYKLGIREVLPPLSVFENLGKFLNDSVKYAQDEIYLEDYIDALKGLAKTAGEATGLPVKYPMDIINKSEEYADNEEFGKLGLLMLGWSPYALRDLEEE